MKKIASEASEEKKEDKEEKKDEGKEKKELPAFMQGKKEASAIDALAYDRAIAMTTEAGFDGAEAGRKIAAAYTLDLVEPSVKVASAPNVDAAVEVRALELLERVGYPVEWK
jgi:hypothetical protein